MSQPTLSIEQATSTQWDAIVVGAGPGGSVAALELARRGVKTLLVDRGHFPRDKVCGGCLNSEAVSTLKELGLESMLATLGAPALNRFDLWAGGSHYETGLSGGLAVSRYTLDAALVEAASAAGVEFLPGVHVQLGSDDSPAEVRRLDCRIEGQPAQLSAQVVVLATGLTSEPLTGHDQLKFRQAPGSRIGVQATIPHRDARLKPGTIYMTVAKAGYVGLTVLEQDRLNLAAAVDLAAVREHGAGEACRRIVEESGIPFPVDLQDATWHATAALTRSRQSHALHRVFLVGDAAGYVEPFTGEGMAAAIRSGRLVGPLVEQSLNHWEPRLIAQWNRIIQAEVTRRQWICRGLSQIVRRPNVVRLGIGLASRVPALGRMVVRMIN